MGRYGEVWGPNLSLPLATLCLQEGESESREFEKLVTQVSVRVSARDRARARVRARAGRAG